MKPFSKKPTLVAAQQQHSAKHAHVGPPAAKCGAISNEVSRCTHRPRHRARFLVRHEAVTFYELFQGILLPVEAIARAAPVASSAAQACSRLRLARARGEHDDRLSQKDVDEQVGKRLIRGVRLLSCFGFCRERHD